jgi:hypothetical protein
VDASSGLRPGKPAARCRAGPRRPLTRFSPCTYHAADRCWPRFGGLGGFVARSAFRLLAEGIADAADRQAVAQGGGLAALAVEGTQADGRSWLYASLEDVRQAVLSTGYDAARVHFVKGKVEDTLPDGAPQQISLLRLDTDWYESTRHELRHLYAP